MDAASQIGEVLDGLQASARFRREGRERRSQQVAERFLIATPYPAAQLVQVTQTKVLRLIDDDCIHVRYIDAAFNDRGCYQHIIIVIDEVQNHFLQFLRFHLSMPYTDAGIGHQAMNHFLQFAQILDAVVHHKHLSVAAHLKADGIGNNILIKDMHLRLDGIAVGRRSLNDRQIARSH